MTQIESLKNAIASGQKHDFFGELENIENAAAKLGYARTDGKASDFNAQLSLKKLEMEMKREDRRFALEMKKDDRMWQLEIKKLEQSAKEADQRLQQESQRYSMLASIPEQIGGAIAKGMIARGENITGMGSQPPPQTQQVPAITVEAGEGEAGELPCPKCNSVIGIGPTTTTTMCAKCSQPFYIKRVAAEPAASGQ
jgi:hypothetical protein